MELEQTFNNLIMSLPSEILFEIFSYITDILLVLRLINSSDEVINFLSNTFISEIRSDVLTYVNILKIKSLRNLRKVSGKLFISISNDRDINLITNFINHKTLNIAAYNNNTIFRLLDKYMRNYDINNKKIKVIIYNKKIFEKVPFIYVYKNKIYSSSDLINIVIRISRRYRINPKFPTKILEKSSEIQLINSVGSIETLFYESLRRNRYYFIDLYIYNELKSIFYNDYIDEDYKNMGKIFKIYEVENNLFTHEEIKIFVSAILLRYYDYVKKNKNYKPINKSIIEFIEEVRKDYSIISLMLPIKLTSSILNFDLSLYSIIEMEDPSFMDIEKIYSKLTYKESNFDLINSIAS